MSVAVVRRAASPLIGAIHLPGDKSLSHRRALMSLFVDGDVRLANYGSGEDCQTTLECLRRLGKYVSANGNSVLISGSSGCRSAELDCQNSGTTARLLMGILSAHEGEWTLHGDRSLSNRPMERVAEPLRKMRAQIELTNGRLPAKITGRRLQGIEYNSPVASAQVKSAVLLAGMRASGTTAYRESVLTRDHTERLLGITKDNTDWIRFDPSRMTLNAAQLSGEIPGDPSTAAFWIAAALTVKGSGLSLPGILSNPQRNGFADLVKQSGGDIQFANVRVMNGENVADLQVRSSSIKAMTIKQPETALMIDELPALAVLASLNNGCEIYDASELHVKESDRLKLITQNLQQMGAQVKVWENGFEVSGQSMLTGVEIGTEGDHRIAMAFAIAGLSAHGETRIQNAECASVSYPEFWTELSRLSDGIVTLES